MKRIVSALAALLILAGTMGCLAENGSRRYLFRLTADGKSGITAQQGEVITVTFDLYRVDAAGQYEIYAMQNEISFDDTLFEYVTDSLTVADRIGTARTQVVKTMNEGSLIYMNYLAEQRNTLWERAKTVGSFRLRVKAETGSAVIRSTHCAVSTKDGTDSFFCAVSDLTVYIGQSDAVRQLTTAHDGSTLRVSGILSGGSAICAVFAPTGKMTACMPAAAGIDGSFTLSVPAKQGDRAVLYAIDGANLPLCPGTVITLEGIK